MKKRFKLLIFLLCIFAALFIAMRLSANHRSDPANIIDYETTNPYIIDGTDISGHRSGGGIAPEETLLALQVCTQDSSFSVDVFEFDLRITKDGVLVLLHDDTLDRTSDCVEVFGETEVRPETKTYNQLCMLNMGAKFQAEDGTKPYADLHGDAVPDTLRILRLEDALDFLSSKGNYKYIIELKNSDELGKQGVDILWNILESRNLTEQVIFGTFHKEISAYVDEVYPGLARSTSISEVAAFWLAALTNSKSYEPPCSVLQIPFTEEYLKYGINLGTTTVVNYAHRHNMAVQYWTINNPEDMAYLASIGADCIMTDYPDVLYDLLHGE